MGYAKGFVEVGVFQLGMGEIEEVRLYRSSRNDSDHNPKRLLDYLRQDSWLAVVAVRTKVLIPTFISGAFGLESQ